MKNAIRYARALACTAAMVAVAGVLRAAVAPVQPAAAGSVSTAGGSTVTVASVAVSAESAAIFGGAELSLSLSRSLLADGDAPGTDSALAGRPAGSTRLLDSALDANGTSRIRIYSSPSSAEAVGAELRGSVIKAGFVEEQVSADPLTTAFRNGHAYLVIKLTRREDRTLVSLTELAFRTSARSE